MKVEMKLCCILLALILSSCTSFKSAMKTPNVNVEFNKSDFILSEQVTAQATSSKVLGIDFHRLITRKSGYVEMNNTKFNYVLIPGVGNVINNKTANYALYELMINNQGFDVVFFPQFETMIVKPILGLGFLNKKTTVIVKARLGKLN